MRRVTSALVMTVACLGVSVQGQRQVFPGPAQFPFSSATKADGLVYVAGTIVAEGDIKAQTKGVLDGIVQTLQKAGSGMAEAGQCGARRSRGWPYAGVCPKNPRGAPSLWGQGKPRPRWSAPSRKPGTGRSPALW